MEAQHHDHAHRLSRAAGVLAGAAVQLLFLATVWRLFWFLKGPTVESAHGSLAWDALLALQFAVPHSVLLLPPVKKVLLRRIPVWFYGCFYCTATCLGLLVVISGWQAVTPALWQIEGLPAHCVDTAFLASWLGLIYSLHLTGLGFQTGLSEWFAWLRRRPIPRRNFAPRGAYCLLRHPAYLSFLGLIWLTPRMTLDRLVLGVVWSSYIYCGSVLKDRRLLFYLGDTYHNYACRVPGFPLLRHGPLAKWPTVSKESVPALPLAPPLSAAMR